MAKPTTKPDNQAPGGKRKRGPRKKERGQAVAAVLLAQREVNDGTTEQGPRPRGQSEGRRGDQVATEARPGHALRGEAGGGGGDKVEIGPTQLATLRRQVLQGALDALQASRVGRPPRGVPPS